jgi:hypothetical protein
VPILKQFFFDVPQHVYAAVCLFLSRVSKWEIQPVTSTAKRETLLPIIRLRQRSSDLDVLHPETTSTRILILSP